MSSADLLEFFGGVAETGDMDTPNTVLNQWENFDMELAMAVLEADATGDSSSSTSPSPPAPSDCCYNQTTCQNSTDAHFSQFTQQQQHQDLLPQYYAHAQQEMPIKQEPMSCSPPHRLPVTAPSCEQERTRKQHISPEQDRKLRRREQNRMAARRCRERKKTARMGLVRQYYELVSANAELQTRIQRLEMEKQRLHVTLDTHVTHCGLPYNPPD